MAIRVTASTNGTYRFVGDSVVIDNYGCLYREPFDSTQPTSNLIAYDDDSGPGSNFQLNATLTPSQSMILVVTTYNTSRTGSFTVQVYGPAQVTMKGMLQFC